MKVLLEAFVDNNFGDNLFLHIITSQNPEHQFYMLEQEKYAASYKILQEKIPNLKVCRGESFVSEMDAMCVVGGDLFWDRADYSKLISHARSVKKRGGKVVFWGFSLFPKYTWYTWFDLMVLFSQADQIVVREEESYRQLKKHIPWLKVVAATDLAFTTDVTELKKGHVQKGLLGVSIRKKIEHSSSTNYPKYCKAVAGMIQDYLAESEEHEVCFLALSTGVHDDREVAEDIKKLCGELYQGRISCSVFDGDVENYMKEIQKCEKLLCTRFHALVFAILLEKAYLPIIYEEKMDRLLHAIGYEGEALRYEAMQKKNALYEKQKEAKLHAYLQKAEWLVKQLQLHKDGARRGNGVFYGLYRIKQFLLCDIYRKLILQK